MCHQAPQEGLDLLKRRELHFNSEQLQTIDLSVRAKATVRNVIITMSIDIIAPHRE